MSRVMLVNGPLMCHWIRWSPGGSGSSLNTITVPAATGRLCSEVVR